VTVLLDVNLLVSLAWPNHVHHAPATAWFRQLGEEPWATTPLTETGFVRVSSNSSAIPAAVSPGAAVGLLARMRGVPGHRFVPDRVEQVVGSHVDVTRITGHQQVTDAHLLAIARQSGARLATFDSGILNLGGSDAVLLIPFS